MTGIFKTPFVCFSFSPVWFNKFREDIIIRHRRAMTNWDDFWNIPGWFWALIACKMKPTDRVVNWFRSNFSSISKTTLLPSRSFRRTSRVAMASLCCWNERSSQRTGKRSQLTSQQLFSTFQTRKSMNFISRRISWLAEPSLCSEGNSFFSTVTDSPEHILIKCFVAPNQISWKSKNQRARKLKS